MGKFSWCTSDTRKSIPCVEDAYKGAPDTVYLLNPFGKPYKEDAYSGDGQFGGRDVFELVAEWNRDFLSAGMLAKPERSYWRKGQDGDRAFDLAVDRHRKLCEAIEDYARGATDEQMKTRYGAILGVLDGPDWKRGLGIVIASSDEQHVKLKYPIKIVEKPCSYDAAGISPDCPRQGCIYAAPLKDIQESVDKSFEKLHAAQEKYVGEKIDALCDFFWASHMEDVVITEDKRGHLVAKDGAGNRWKDAEIYDFVLNECLGFEPDGKLQFGYGAISQDLADTLKAHAAGYGVLAQIPEVPSKQYTLEYLNDAGDIITRDYFQTDDEAKQLAMALLDTYKKEGSESVQALCITDDHGLTVWKAELDHVDNKTRFEGVAEVMARHNDCLIIEENDLVSLDRNTGALEIDNSAFDAFEKDTYINIYISGDDFIGQYKMLEETSDGIRMEYIGEADWGGYEVEATAGTARDNDLTIACDETIQIWLDTLLETTGKSSLEELTPEEIKAEIEEVQGTIANETVFGNHKNIAVLEEYLDELNELLEAADPGAKSEQARTLENEDMKKQSLASKIAQAEKVKRSARQEVTETNEKHNGGNFNERDSYN